MINLVYEVCEYYRCRKVGKKIHAPANFRKVVTVKTAVGKDDGKRCNTVADYERLKTVSKVM